MKILRRLALLFAVLLTACTFSFPDAPAGTPTPKDAPAKPTVKKAPTRTPKKTPGKAPTRSPKKTPGKVPTRSPNRAPVDSPGGRLGVTGVTLWVFPDDGVDPLVEMITSAKTRVWLTIYMLSEVRIFDALKTAKDNGIDVRVLIEPSPLGGASSAKAALSRLKRDNIEVKTANPAFRLTHEKSYVIDNEMVILTSNMTRSSFTRNREFAVVHRDPQDVDELVRAFNADWNREEFVPQSPNLVWSPDNSRVRIDALIEGAQKTLEVYAASTLDDEQLGLLAQAQKRGVKVRLITSPRAPEGEDPAASDLDNLQRARVKVRYIKVPLIHAKAFIADFSEPSMLGFVGSINITAQSLDFNRELGILLADEDALTRIHDTFEQDWSKSTDR
ncbi:MAG: phospholipase D-like domain-containing protein [Chloroflexi bacterium]|nr:phospholipase D-like domain-containing protein [Chloroflexota bacterium]